MSEQEQSFAAHNAYLQALFAPEDDALRLTREDALSEGLPEIHVSPAEGKMLHTLAVLTGAKRILEIGTLGGYSAIWLGRALPPEGKLISLEIDAHHADVARRNIARAGLASSVEVRTAPAQESLAQMQGEEPFDLVFIDADKDGYVEYLNLVYPMVRAGGLILGDNTLPKAILSDEEESGTKRYNAAVAAHPGLVSIVVPVLRNWGVDGLTVSVKQ